MNHGIATSVSASVPLATSAGKCSFSAPLEYGLRSRKKLPRMPGHTTSTLNTSMSAAPAPSSCCATASFSLDEVGEVTTLTLLPVLLAQASAPSLQTSYSWPTEPHEIAISTDAGAAGGAAAAEPEPSVGFLLPAPSSAFLQPAATKTSEHSTVSVFITRPLSPRVTQSQRAIPPVLSPMLTSSVSSVRRVAQRRDASVILEQHRAGELVGAELLERPPQIARVRAPRAQREHDAVGRVGHEIHVGRAEHRRRIDHDVIVAGQAQPLHRDRERRAVEQLGLLGARIDRRDVQPQLRDVDQAPRHRRLVAMRSELLGEAPRRDELEHAGELRPAHVGLDQQGLGPAALGEREREVDRGGGLAVAALRARHDHDLRPADLEQVVAQHAERRAAVGVGIDQQREPRIDVLVGEVVLGQIDLRRRARRLGLRADHHLRLAVDERGGLELALADRRLEPPCHRSKLSGLRAGQLGAEDHAGVELHRRRRAVDDGLLRVAHVGQLASLDRDHRLGQQGQRRTLALAERRRRAGGAGSGRVAVATGALAHSGPPLSSFGIRLVFDLRLTWIADGITASTATPSRSRSARRYSRSSITASPTASDRPRPRNSTMPASRKIVLPGPVGRAGLNAGSTIASRPPCSASFWLASIWARNALSASDCTRSRCSATARRSSLCSPSSRTTQLVVASALGSLVFPPDLDCSAAICASIVCRSFCILARSSAVAA